MQDAMTPSGLAPAEQLRAAGVDQNQPNSNCGRGGQCGEEGGCGGGSGGGNNAGALPSTPSPPIPAAGTVCMKCRKQEAQLVARGREPMCFPCLHEQLLSKVRNAVRMNSLLLPGDQLALAFSGGPASATLLHFLAELRNPCTDRPARGKVAFTMHVIHIDESAAMACIEPSQGSTDEHAAAGGHSASVAAAAQLYCHEPGVQYHCVPLEAVFDGTPEAAAGQDAAGLQEGQDQQQSRELQRRQLQHLLAAVSDTTGRQDLVCHLRTHLLLRTAAALGCCRMARGDCSTALAARVVAAAAKGCGYSLAGDVRLVDARHGRALPPCFLPLREVSSRELGMLCSHLRLPVARQPAGVSAAGQRAAKKSINSLADAFIAGMELHNPGSVPNILNTIAKLEAFPWNDPTATRTGQTLPQQQQHGVQQQQQQRQQEQQQQQHVEAAVLCPICLAPLADDELPGSDSNYSSSNSGSEHTSGGTGAASAAAAAGCCLSCYCQILGGGSEAVVLAGSGVAAALPLAVSQRMASMAMVGSQLAAKEAKAAVVSDGAEPASGGVERLRAHIAEFLLDT